MLQRPKSTAVVLTPQTSTPRRSPGQSISANDNAVDGGVLTVDMSVGFMNAGLSDKILAEARVLHAGQSTAFCESEARDAAGKLLAKAIGTFKLLSDRK